MSQIPSSSSLNSKPKAITQQKVRENGKVRTRNVVVPVENLHQVMKLNTVYTQSIKGVPANLFRSSGSRFSGTLEQKAFYLLDNLSLKITLQTSGGDSNYNYVFVDPTYLFERIEIRASNGSQHLNIIYDDNMNFALSTLDDIRIETMATAMGLNVDVDGSIVGNPKIEGNGTVTFFLPLLGSWIENADIWFKSIDGDIIFDFYPVSNALLDQDPDNKAYVNCTSIDFVIETVQPTPQDIITQTNFNDQAIIQKSFLDVTPIYFFNYELRANVQSKFELDTLHGDYAFLLVIIREQNSNAGNKKTSEVSPGNNAKIDLLDPGSMSLLGSGTGIDYIYLKNVLMVRHFNNRFLNNRNMFVLPFGGSVQRAFDGVHDGSHFFDGSRFYLSITPDDTFENGHFDVTVYGYHYKKLIMDKGRLVTRD